MINDKNTIYLMCDCNKHTLQASYDKECDIIEISLWSCYIDNRIYGLKERLRWCWNILWTGNPWSDFIILNKENALKLSNFIKEKLMNKIK